MGVIDVVILVSSARFSALFAPKQPVPRYDIRHMYRLFAGAILQHQDFPLTLGGGGYMAACVAGAAQTISGGSPRPVVLLRVQMWSSWSRSARRPLAAR
jgi:hypothetical protein